MKGTKGKSYALALLAVLIFSQYAILGFADEAEFVSQRYHYTLKAPDSSWKVLSKPNNIINNPDADCEMYSDEKKALFISVVDKLGLSLEALKTFVLENAKGEGEGLNILSEDKLTIDGREAYKISFTVYIDGMTVRYDTYCLVNGESAYQLMGFALEEDYNPQTAQDFAKIANSFHLAL